MFRQTPPPPRRYRLCAIFVWWGSVEKTLTRVQTKCFEVFQSGFLWFFKNISVSLRNKRSNACTWLNIKTRFAKYIFMNKRISESVKRTLMNKLKWKILKCLYNMYSISITLFKTFYIQIVKLQNLIFFSPRSIRRLIRSHNWKYLFVYCN